MEPNRFSEGSEGEASPPPAEMTSNKDNAPSSVWADRSPGLSWLPRLPNLFGAGAGPGLIYPPPIPGDKNRNKDQGEDRHRPQAAKGVKDQLPARTQHVPQSDKGGTPENGSAVSVQAEPGVREFGNAGDVRR